MNDEKFTRMVDQNEILTRQFQHILSKYYRYGPDAPKVCAKFIASLAKNTGVKEGMNMIRVVLDKHFNK